jgi:hypothetical protein
MTEACCIDENCSLQGQDVKESIRENAPSWLSDLKYLSIISTMMAVVVIGKFALYMY